MNDNNGVLLSLKNKSDDINVVHVKIFKLTNDIIALILSEVAYSINKYNLLKKKEKNLLKHSLQSVIFPDLVKIAIVITLQKAAELLMNK